MSKYNYRGSTSDVIRSIKRRLGAMSDEERRFYLARAVSKGYLPKDTTEQDILTEIEKNGGVLKSVVNIRSYPYERIIKKSIKGIDE